MGQHTTVKLLLLLIFFLIFFTLFYIRLGSTNWLLTNRLPMPDDEGRRYKDNWWTDRANKKKTSEWITAPSINRHRVEAFACIHGKSWALLILNTISEHYWYGTRYQGIVDIEYTIGTLMIWNMLSGIVDIQYTIRILIWQSIPPLCVQYICET